MCEFAYFSSEDSARLLESHLISILPNILNRTHVGERFAFQERMNSKPLVGEIDADGSIRLTEEEFWQSDTAHLGDEVIDDGFVI